MTFIFQGVINFTYQYQQPIDQSTYIKWNYNIYNDIQSIRLQSRYY